MGGLLKHHAVFTAGVLRGAFLVDQHIRFAAFKFVSSFPGVMGVLDHIVPVPGVNYHIRFHRAAGINEGETVIEMSIWTVDDHRIGVNAIGGAEIDIQGQGFHHCVTRGVNGQRGRRGVRNSHQLKTDKGQVSSVHHHILVIIARRDIDGVAAAGFIDRALERIVILIANHIGRTAAAGGGVPHPLAAIPKERIPAVEDLFSFLAGQGQRIAILIRQFDPFLAQQFNQFLNFFRRFRGRFLIFFRSLFRSRFNQRIHGCLRRIFLCGFPGNHSGFSCGLAAIVSKNRADSSRGHHSQNQEKCCQNIKQLA